MSKFYVCMNDSFMSNWGPAEGKTNVLQIACDTQAQAQAVLKAAEDRPEMKRIRINTKPIRDNASSCVSEKTFYDLSGPWLAYWPSLYQIMQRAMTIIERESGVSCSVLLDSKSALIFELDKEKNTVIVVFQGDVQSWPVSRHDDGSKLAAEILRFYGSIFKNRGIK